MANRILHEYKDAYTLPALSSAPSLTTWQALPRVLSKLILMVLLQMAALPVLGLRFGIVKVALL